MLNAGMNGYLAKPLKVDKLYTALETFMKPKEYQEINKINNNENELNVLDLEEGLAYMKGNKLFYQEVLLEFMDAYATSAMTFESMVDKKKYDEIELLFLDMKGLTGAIGAKNIFSLVSEIHQIMGNKEYKALKSYMVKYRTELTYLKNAIDSYLNS
jgi:HPt (histidine-containing phosphotransfer) domain-containing protein